MKFQKHVKVELLKKKHARPLDMVQFDTGIQIIIEVTDFDLPTGTTATLYVQKPSGKFVYQESGVSVAGNVTTIDLENQALTEHGKVYYQVRFENGADLLSTFSGIMFVEKSLADSGAVESETVLAAFKEVTNERIAEVQAAAAEQIALVQQEGQTQVAAVQATSQAEQEAIEAKGAATLATIPDEYTEIANAVKIKANALSAEDSGNPVTFYPDEGSILRPVLLFEPVQPGNGDPCTDGKGKNLLPYVVKTTINGATLETLEDGGVHISGTPTANTFFNIDCSIVLNGTYVFSMGNKEAIGDHLQIRLLDESGNQGNTNVTAANADAYIIYSTAKTIKKFVIRLGAGVAYDVTIYPMLEAGTVKTDFVPTRNIRPISGRTAASLSRTKKNLVYMPSVTVTGEHPWSNDYRDILLPPGTYTMRSYAMQAGTITHVCMSVRLLSDPMTQIVAKSINYENGDIFVTFTIPEGEKGVRVYFYSNLTADVISSNCTFHNITVEMGDKYTGFEGYYGDTFTIDFGQTVYGGTLDLQTGVLTVDRAMVTLDGTQTVQNFFAGRHGSMIVRYYAADAAAVGSPDVDVRLTSSALKAVSADSQYVSMVNTIACNNSQDSLLVCIDGMTTEAEVTAWLAANPVQVVYPLANPTTIQLSPVEITGLAGLNAMYTDADGLNVGYNKSLNRAFEEALARIAVLENAMVNNV